MNKCGNESEFEKPVKVNLSDGANVNWKGKLIWEAGHHFESESELKFGTIVKGKVNLRGRDKAESEFNREILFKVTLKES